MVPIHDTDVAEERWAQSEWDHYELWEKVESRLLRRRRLWIAGTVAVFLGLSAIPIVRDQWPRWAALSASRRLAQEINSLKREANVDRSAFRITYAPKAGQLSFAVERLETCADAFKTPERYVTVSSAANAAGLILLESKQGEGLGVPGLVSSFCYDPLKGSVATLAEEAAVGLGIVTAKDLPSLRADRVSVLLVSGPSAELGWD